MFPPRKKPFPGQEETTRRTGFVQLVPLLLEALKPLGLLNSLNGGLIPHFAPRAFVSRCPAGSEVAVTVIRDVDVSANHPGWNARHNGTGRDVFEDDGVGADYRAFADAD